MKKIFDNLKRLLKKFSLRAFSLYKKALKSKPDFNAFFMSYFDLYETGGAPVLRLNAFEKLKVSVYPT